MSINKEQVLELIKGFPEDIDIEEIMYRLYLKQKLESAERNIQEGKTLAHDEVIKETSRWFGK
jgi:hypothetical protein